MKERRIFGFCFLAEGQDNEAEREWGCKMKNILCRGIMIGCGFFAMYMIAGCGGGGGSDDASSSLTLSGTVTTTSESQTSTSASISSAKSVAKESSAAAGYEIIPRNLAAGVTCDGGTIDNAGEFTLKCDGFVGKDFRMELVSGHTPIGTFAIASGEGLGDYSSILATEGSTLGFVLDYDEDTTIPSGYVSEGAIGVTNPVDLTGMPGLWTMVCADTGIGGDERNMDSLISVR